MPTTSGGLNFSYPNEGDKNWTSTMVSSFNTISSHGHTGTGDGVQISTSAIASNAVTDTKILLANNAWLKAKNTSNAATNLLRYNSSNVAELAFRTSTGGTGTLGSGTLGNYEFGTFTPTIDGLSSAGAGTYTTQSGWYQVIGQVCFFNIDLTWSAHTGTGDAQISGLPFAAVSTAGSTLHVAPVRYGSTYTFTSGMCVGLVGSGSSTGITLYHSNVTAAIPLDTSASIQVSGHYRIT